MKTVFGQVPYSEYAWVRFAGLEAFGLALLMVLVAHRAAEVWWEKGKATLVGRRETLEDVVAVECETPI